MSNKTKKIAAETLTEVKKKNRVIIKKVKYQPRKIEKKWQLYWEKKNLYQTKDFSKKSKFFILDMFPYPSGYGLHVGHFKGYVATDIIARMKRMQGFNVLHPMGWDAFGLPAENYAIKTGIHPAITTKKNIKRIKKQMKMVGLSYDWTREINTTEPSYYRWTQWIFLKLFEKKLAYEAILPINWCSNCQTGLANEEVVNGQCERCQTTVMKKNIRQWVLKITAYADRLLKDLNQLDWPKQIKEMQKNWIGKSHGTIVRFKIKKQKIKSKNTPDKLLGSYTEQVNQNLKISYIEVFTTRVDTLFGCTYLVVSPEKAREWKLENEKTKKYIDEAQSKLERERQIEEREKTGVFSGYYAINPVNNKKIPILIADYVLADYGTGAIMAVPAHDQRDFEFAQKYHLPIIKVIQSKKKEDNEKIIAQAYEKDGFLINSGPFSGLTSEMARKKITQFLKEKGLGDFKTNYKLRDWLFSRQRYWGEPIPIIHCRKCGLVPVPEKELPLKLPKVKKYQPSGTSESPLATIESWLETKCPKCWKKAKRETNTMPQWAGSCWYYLRYLDSQNKKTLVSKKKEKYWLPVDLYVGGVEHAVLHLLYVRFWHKFLFDLGIVSTPEPFSKFRNVGIVLAEDGRKMSKSFNNVIAPDEIIKNYGADSLRLYEMFMGPFNETISWSAQGFLGCHRFLKRIWNLFSKKEKIGPSNYETKTKLHQLIKKVSEDLEVMKFNTAIAAMMEFVNFLSQPKQKLSPDERDLFLKILAPFVPHFCEELWFKIRPKKYKKNYSIFKEKWPKFNPLLIQENIFTLVIQINGKVRDKITIQDNLSQPEIEKIVLAREKVKKWLRGQKIKKIIFVPRKLINLVS